MPTQKGYPVRIHAEGLNLRLGTAKVAAAFTRNAIYFDPTASMSESWFLDVPCQNTPLRLDPTKQNQRGMFFLSGAVSSGSPSPQGQATKLRIATGQFTISMFVREPKPN